MENDFDEKTLLERYELIGGPDETIPLLRRVAAAIAADPALAELAHRQSAALFTDVPGADSAALRKWTIPDLGDATGAFNLAVSLSSVPLVAATHRRFGFPKEQLARTYSWFRVMLKVYAKRHGGAPGINHTRSFWFRHHVDGTLFRFGSMEFLRGPIPKWLPEEVRSQFAPDDEVPTFHYPGGEGGLDEDSLKASFAEAMDFWKRTFGKWPKAWCTESWLYNPAWRELIPNSRIAHAIDLFEELPPLAPNPIEPAGLFYVYAADDVDPRDFPIVNSLERAFATIFERGGKLVEGCAIVRCDDSGNVLFRR